MNQQHFYDINHFFVAGINYKKTDAAVRGTFAISSEQYIRVIDASNAFGVSEFFILSTCNRTEIYGFAENAQVLSRLICTQSEGTRQEFEKISYHKSGLDAVEHLFNVAAGLDSQILGDYEIIGQIKLAARIAKENNCMGAYLERMINDVLQASKKIRTETRISGGTVSVSFAAVQCIQNHFPDFDKRKILLIGTGKIGGNTCKNLVDYLPGATLTLLNRSEEKMMVLAQKYNLPYDSLNNMEDYISHADVIIVTTAAEEPILLKTHFKKEDRKLIIDLSVPCNVSASVKDFVGIHLINIDELSKIKDETLQMRAVEIPKVKAIIAAQISVFAEWYEMRKNVPILQAMKNQLWKIQLHNTEKTLISVPVSSLTRKTTEEKIQKILNGMAVKMRVQNNPGCHYIEAISDYMTSN